MLHAVYRLSGETVGSIVVGRGEVFRVFLDDGCPVEYIYILVVVGVVYGSLDACPTNWYGNTFFIHDHDELLFNQSGYLLIMCQRVWLPQNADRMRWTAGNADAI